MNFSKIESEITSEEPAPGLPKTLRVRREASGRNDEHISFYAEVEGVETCVFSMGLDELSSFVGELENFNA